MGLGQLDRHWSWYRNVPVEHVRHTVGLTHETHGDMHAVHICRFCKYWIYIPVGHSIGQVPLNKAPLRQLVQFVPITEQVRQGK